MGWQERDYARGGSYGCDWPLTGGLRRLWNSSVVSRLIVINVAVFLACLLSSGRGHESPLYTWGVLDYQDIVHGGQIWRIVTPIFLHSGYMHILLNMIGLWMFGGPVEAQWGPRATFLVFMVSAILGNVAYLILVAIQFFRPVQALGASGGVLAIMGAAAVLMPRMRVYFYGIFGVPLGGLAIVFGVGYLVNVWNQGFNAGGDVCHLVGMVCGAGYAWAWRNGWIRSGGGFGGGGRVERAGRGRGAPAFMRPSDVDRDRLELDDLLRKVHDRGLESLTAGERRRLTEITERLRSDFDSL